MFDKERLLRISELDEAEVAQAADGRMNDFATSANLLIDNFPKLAENVKTALDGKNRGELSKQLTDVCSILQQIFAVKLANTCAGKLGNINDIQEDDLQAFVTGFLKTVSALSIDLQMAEYQETPELSAEPSTDSSRAAEVKNTILAVDDRHFFLTAIKTMLQDTGYKVTCINSGAAALNYLKNHKPDLFILDIEMPEMDGYELAGKIKASGHTSPIIFLTGNAKKDSVVKALQAGAADFIVKPVTKDQLLERIGKYIEPEIKEDEEE